MAVNNPSNCLSSNQSSPDTAKETATASKMNKSDSLSILISLLVKWTFIRWRLKISLLQTRWNPTAATNKPAIVTAAGIRKPTIPKTSIIDGMRPVNPSGTHKKNGVATTTPTHPATRRGEKLDLLSPGSDALWSSLTVTILFPFFAQSAPTQNTVYPAFVLMHPVF